MFANTDQGPKPVHTALLPTEQFSVSKNIKHMKIQWTSQLTPHHLVSAGLAVRSGNTVAYSCKKDIQEIAGCFLTPPIILHLSSSIKPWYCFLSLSLSSCQCVWGTKKNTRDDDGFPVLPTSQMEGWYFEAVQCFHGKGKLTLDRTTFFMAWYTCNVLTLLYKLTCLTESLMIVMIRKKWSDEKVKQPAVMTNVRNSKALMLALGCFYPGSLWHLPGFKSKHNIHI